MRKTRNLLLILLSISALCCLFALLLRGQTIHYTRPPDVSSGEKVYKAGCIACHGSDGRGAPQSSTVFTRPDTWPDFTRCDQTTPEANSAWKAVIVHGGPSRGSSQIMPSFGDLLTNEQIDDVIAYMRGFCQNVHHYPPGELNLPRALVTEKAFPEDELVVSTSMNATGAPSFTTDVIHEQTFKGRNQIEVDVPVNYADQNHDWTSGVGDITLGLKREMFSSARTGSIFSLQGGVLLPTGDSDRGFGNGTNTFLQFQAGADLTVDSAKTPRSVFWRTAAGQALAPDHGLGRLFSPMVEVVGTRNFRDGAKADWDVVPQMQVTISRRQHIRADVGVRQPFTDTSGRSTQVLFYVLWDWADGKFWEGW